MDNTQPKFEWTDELVKDFLNDGEDLPHDWDIEIEKFKKSKVLPEQQERIDISRLQIHDNFIGNGNDSFWYQFCSSKYLSVDDCSKLSDQIESALNDIVVEDKPEQYNEVILKVFDKGIGKDYVLPDGTKLCEWSAYEMLFDQLQEVLKDKFENKKLSQSEVDAIREETWKAVRLNADNHSGTIRFHDGEGTYYYNKKFTTLQDYLKSLHPLPDNKAYTGKEETTQFSDYKIRIGDEFKGGFVTELTLINNTVNLKVKRYHKSTPEQPTNDNAFVWTPELINDFMNEGEDNYYDWLPQIKKFQQSKQSAPPESKQQKDYEILFFSFNGLDNIPVVCGKDSDYYHVAIKEPSKHTINSVKRLSDGEVFSVGETVLWDDKPVLINGFEIYNGNSSVRSGMMFYTIKGDNCNINYAQKLPPIEQEVKTDNSDVACISINNLKELDYAGKDVLMVTYKKLHDFVNKKLKQ